jgi:hypothetical protein
MLIDYSLNGNTILMVPLSSLSKGEFFMHHNQLYKLLSKQEHCSVLHMEFLELHIFASSGLVLPTIIHGINLEITL